MDQIVTFFLVEILQAFKASFKSRERTSSVDITNLDYSIEDSLTFNLLLNFTCRKVVIMTLGEKSKNFTCNEHYFTGP